MIYERREIIVIKSETDKNRVGKREGIERIKIFLFFFLKSVRYRGVVFTEMFTDKEASSPRPCLPFLQALFHFYFTIALLYMNTRSFLLYPLLFIYFFSIIFLYYFISHSQWQSR